MKSYKALSELEQVFTKPTKTCLDLFFLQERLIILDDLGVERIGRNSYDTLLLINILRSFQTLELLTTFRGCLAGGNETLGCDLN